MKSGATAQDINFDAPKLESTEEKLQSHNVQIKEMNIELNKKTSKDQKKIDEQNRQMEQLKKEREELQKQVQAKAEQKERLRIAAENAALTLTATKKASAAAAPAPMMAANIGSTPQEWMAAAGIPQSDWVYVDCVVNGCQGVSAEGGWGGTLRWNTTGSGAYGLCQALPGSKMASAGADWETNPVTQLRWCDSYAQGYGGWAKAWEFRKCLGSCFSTRTNNTQYKDHTWW